MNPNHDPITGEFSSGGGGGGNLRAQFNFLDLRTRSGGLKPGELSMIEKRRDRVAKMILNSPRRK